MNYPQVTNADYPNTLNQPQSYQPMYAETHAHDTTDHERPESNYLISAATSLITLIAHIKHTVEQKNVATLRAQVVEEIKTFEHKLSDINYPIRTIVAARYCLCTAIDEAVLSRPWGTQSDWIQNSLLSLFHKETRGGKRFYIILQDMLRNPKQNSDFIELAYYLLSLGFEGEFHGEQNQAAREDIRNRIFYHIRHIRKKPARQLSGHSKVQHIFENTQDRIKKLKKVALICGSGIAVLYLLFNVLVSHDASKVLTQLDQIGNVSPITTFSQVIQRPIVIRTQHNEA